MGHKVAIVMGSRSDEPVMQGAADVLEQFHIQYETFVASAHRSPHRVQVLASGAVEAGFEVIIAGAGGAAHLPGVVASLTPLPVIGVPIKTDALGGLDSLLSIAQMPAGVPVATMAINGAKNAAVLAAEIIGVADPEVRRKVVEYKEKLAEQVGK